MKYKHETFNEEGISSILDEFLISDPFKTFFIIEFDTDKGNFVQGVGEDDGRIRLEVSKPEHARNKDDTEVNLLSLGWVYGDYTYELFVNKDQIIDGAASLLIIKTIAAFEIEEGSDVKFTISKK